MTKEEYKAALYWVHTELMVAESNPLYKKETLISNVRDKVSAALELGSYVKKKKKPGSQ